jgi:DnaJ family protein C protein 28
MPNVEDLIKKAMQEGKFDNLPGKGKKIELQQTNPHADPEWEIAFGMLKNAGYTLPWIETLQGIKKDLEAAREELRLAWLLYKFDYGQTKTAGDSAAQWEHAKAAFRVKLDEVNRRIRDYNLHVPAVRFQRQVLTIDQEINNITKNRAGE